MTTIALVYPHPLVPLTCPLHNLISSSRSGCSIMRVTHKAGDPYDYMTPRPTRDEDLAAQLILLMRLALGDTAYCWFMEAVHLALISSLLAHHTRHDLSRISHTHPSTGHTKVGNYATPPP
jgi:hypothetical protein